MTETSQCQNLCLLGVIHQNTKSCIFNIYDKSEQNVYNTRFSRHLSLLKHNDFIFRVSSYTARNITTETEDSFLKISVLLFFLQHFPEFIFSRNPLHYSMSALCTKMILKDCNGLKNAWKGGDEASAWAQINSELIILFWLN